MKRDRLIYFISGVIVVILGLLSRKYRIYLPTFIGEYAGDTLWALMTFIGFGFLFPKWSSLRVALTALIFSYLIEISQLYQAPWINQIRRTLIGSLILGFGFLWSDLICYTMGVMLGLILEMLFFKWQNNRKLN